MPHAQVSGNNTALTSSLLFDYSVADMLNDVNIIDKGRTVPECLLFAMFVVHCVQKTERKFGRGVEGKYLILRLILYITRLYVYKQNKTERKHPT